VKGGRWWVPGIETERRRPGPTEESGGKSFASHAVGYDGPKVVSCKLAP